MLHTSHRYWVDMSLFVDVGYGPGGEESDGEGDGVDAILNQRTKYTLHTIYRSA